MREDDSNWRISGWFRFGKAPTIYKEDVFVLEPDFPKDSVEKCITSIDVKKINGIQDLEFIPKTRGTGSTVAIVTVRMGYP